MIDEKPEDPAEPKADPLIDFLTGRGPPPWKRRWKRGRKRLRNQREMFRKHYTSERATEPEAPAPILRQNQRRRHEERAQNIKAESR